MADTTLPGLLATGDHASRPAASAVGSGALYSCTTHNLVYQSDGSAWSTWATLGGGTVAADDVSITDSGAYFTGTDVEAALQELGAGGGGGGGGGGTTILGKTTTGASQETMAATRIYAKKITVPSAGTILSVASRVKASGTSQVQWLAAATYADNAGVVGQLLGFTADMNFYLQTDAGGTIPAHTIYLPSGTHVSGAGDYWIAVRWNSTNGTPNLFYDTGGSDRYFAASYWATGGTVFAQTDSTRNYDMWAPFLPD